MTIAIIGAFVIGIMIGIFISYMIHPTFGILAIEKEGEKDIYRLIFSEDPTSVKKKQRVFLIIKNYNFSQDKQF